MNPNPLPVTVPAPNDVVVAWPEQPQQLVLLLHGAGQRPAAMREMAGSLDLIINTVSAGLDMATYLGLLDVDGTLVNVGAPAEPYAVPAFSLMPARGALAGSTTGGIAEIQEMLAFCAEHRLHPETELVAADRINEAWERVLASDVRYRFVIDTHTL